MPNEVSCTLTVAGLGGAVRRFHEAAENAEAQVPDFSKGIDWDEKGRPVLSYKSEYDGLDFSEIAPESKQRKIEPARVVRTLWPDEEEMGEAEYEFRTPWTPPIEAIEEAAASYPDLAFKLEYFEPNCNFSGRVVCAEGEVRDKLTEEITSECACGCQQAWYTISQDLEGSEHNEILIGENQVNRLAELRDLHEARMALTREAVDGEAVAAPPVSAEDAA